jgi:hypothetical protein
VPATFWRGSLGVDEHCKIRDIADSASSEDAVLRAVNESRPGVPSGFGATSAGSPPIHI